MRLCPKLLRRLCWQRRCFTSTGLSLPPTAASLPSSSVGRLYGAPVFACPINFTILKGLPKVLANGETPAPTRCLTILIRGAPFIRMVGDKPAETFLKRSISSASNGRSFRIFDFDPGFRRTGAIRRIEFLSPLACDDTGD
jgi:hypothetical protein